MSNPWTIYTNETCIFWREGWGLFLSDMEEAPYAQIRIGRIDERGVFEGDDAALAFVQARAAEGSKLHADALALHLTTPED